MYLMPVMVLGTGETAVNKTNKKNPCPHGDYILVGGDK